MCAWITPEIILSLAAIIVAILIPTKIAQNQNKIATFEKRMDCYNQLLKFVLGACNDYVAIDNLVSHTKTRRISGITEQANLMTRVRLLFPEKMSKKVDDLLLSYNSVNALDIQLGNAIAGLTEQNKKELSTLLQDDMYLKAEKATKGKVQDILSDQVYFNIAGQTVQKTVYDLMVYQKGLILLNEKESNDLLREMEKEISLYRIKQF